MSMSTMITDDELVDEPKSNTSTRKYKQTKASRPGASGPLQDEQATPQCGVRRASAMERIRERRKEDPVRLAGYVNARNTTGDVASSPGRNKKKSHPGADALEWNEVEANRGADARARSSSKGGSRDVTTSSSMSRNHVSATPRRQSRTEQDQFTRPPVSSSRLQSEQSRGLFALLFFWMKQLWTLIQWIWKKHLLGKIALVLLALLLVINGARYGIAGFQEMYYLYCDLRYGSPRMQQIDASIGIQDDAAHPSHLVLTNVQHRLHLTVYVGNAPTNKIDYVSDELIGSDTDRWNVSLSLKPGAKSGLQNVVITYGNLFAGYEHITLINDGKRFTVEK